MQTVNILEAKTHLSRFVEDIASGNHDVIVIARNGKPAAQLVPIDQRPIKIGVLKGKYRISPNIDVDNAEIAAEFEAP